MGIEGNLVLRTCKPRFFSMKPLDDHLFLGPQAHTDFRYSYLRFWGEGENIPKGQAKNSRE